MRYLLYDNECSFCYTIVNKVSSLINNRKIDYIPIKSIQGEKLIKKYHLENVKSVIYIDNNKVFIKSSAILHISKQMDFPYKLLYVLNILPKPILNIGYDFIAKNRKHIKIEDN